MNIQEFIKKNKPFLEEQYNYLLDKDWTNYLPTRDEFLEDKDYTRACKINLGYRKSETELQEQIAKGVFNRLKYYVNIYTAKAFTPEFRHFSDLAVNIIELYCDRGDSYTLNNPFSGKQFEPIKREEISFQNSVFEKTSKLREELSKLPMEEETSELQFYDNQMPPLAMHPILSEKYPYIRKKISELGVDFNRTPEPTIHKNNENPPKWEEGVAYYNQKKETLQYYIDELNKIKDGIIIDGTYINGWIYFHMNFFKTSYPVETINKYTGEKESNDIIGTPPLRDNEWFTVMDNYEGAKRDNKMMFTAATRRAAKTTLNASHLAWCSISGKRRILCAGGNSDDLSQMTQNFQICMENIDSAFSINLLKQEWDSKVLMGVKTKSGHSILSAIMRIKNLDGGAKKKSESLAGFTPDAVLIDEIMKIPFKSQLEALLPALSGAGGKLRCVVILTGTAGNSELAKDAFNVLRDPVLNNIYNMPWHILDKMAGEYATWKHRPFGTFLPGQMAMHPLGKTRKVKSNLADYLSVQSEELSKIEIMVTDWKFGKENLESHRSDLKKDLEKYTKEVLYYPMDPSDMLLSSEINPFPVQDAIFHREYLLSKGKTGMKVSLHQTPDGVITAVQSNKELAVYPHPGGYIDAPVVLYEDLPDKTPPDYLYVAGFDDYKQDESTTDSVGSFHIYRVDAGFVKDGGRLVASLATRPDPHPELHRQIYMLQQAFNAVCMMENADMDYKTYLDNRKVADRWLEKSMDFESNLTMLSDGRRKYGWNPSPKNKKMLLSLAINYTKREFDSVDEEGEPTTIKGIYNIPDIQLLDEIIGYATGKNVDRITSFMSCLGQEFYYHNNNMYPNINRNLEKDREKEKVKKVRGQNYFTKTRGRGFF